MEVLINIDVPDIQAAAHFYIYALGLQRGRQLDSTTLELLGAGANIYLLQVNEEITATAEGDKRTYKRHWCPVHLDFVVPDIQIALEKVLKEGAKIEKPVQIEPYGKLAVLSDPFGHGFCLIEFTGHGYDEYLIKNPPSL
jgi:predicted enzyme related to lactoylglutathione lyase